jgi:excisionase family DNA binding protein
VEDRLLFRVPEVAVFLNISRSKVYELLGSGDLPSVKIDRTRLVRGSDLKQYVESLRPVIAHNPEVTGSNPVRATSK